MTGSSLAPIAVAVALFSLCPHEASAASGQRRGSSDKRTSAYRELIEISRGLYFPMYDDWTRLRTASRKLLDNGDMLPAHAMLYGALNGYPARQYWDDLARLSRGVVIVPSKDLRPILAEGNKPDPRWLEREFRPCVLRAERWWASRRSRALRPIAREIKQLRSEADGSAWRWDRRRATMALYILGADCSEKWLLSLLDDEDGFIQNFGVCTLLRTGSTGFVNKHIAILATDKDPLRRARAAGILCGVILNTGGEKLSTRSCFPEARDALVKVLDDADETVAGIAALGLLPRDVRVSSRRGLRYHWICPDMKQYGSGLRAIVDDLVNGGQKESESLDVRGTVWSREKLVQSVQALRRLGDTPVIVKGGHHLLALAERPVEERSRFFRRALATPLREFLKDAWLQGSTGFGSAVTPDIQLEQRPGLMLSTHNWTLFPKDALPELLAIVQKTEPDFRYFDPGLGLAVGVLLEDDTSNELLSLVQAHKSNPKRAAIAGVGLAMIGDRRAIPHLKLMLGNDALEVKTRSWAGLSLAGLGELDCLPELQAVLEQVKWSIPFKRPTSRKSPPRPKPAKAGTLSVGTKIPAEQMDWLRSQPKAHVPRIEPGMQADEFRRAVEEWWAARKGPSARDVF
jgi:hypothetical protein